MKKFTKTVSVLLFGLILFSTTSAYADPSLKGALSTVDAINAVAANLIKIYDKIPEAQYVVNVCTNDGCEDRTVNSCALALAKARGALKSRGVTEVTINSVYTTAFTNDGRKYCDRKTYTNVSQLPF